MFNDLIKEKQEEISNGLGYPNIEECLIENNWNIIPLIILDIGED